jgi:hypothetical protein
MNIEGNVDSLSVFARGWAIDWDNESGACAIDVIVNDKKVVTVLSGNLLRPDVTESLHQKGINTDSFRDAMGFNLDLRPWLNIGKNKVCLKFNRTGESIPSGTEYVIYSPFNLKPIEGQKGFLFSNEDGIDALDSISGIKVMPNDSIKETCKNAVILQHFCSLYNSRLLLSIIPDRIAVTPYLVSPDFTASEKRSAFKLRDQAKQFYDINIEYPIHLLEEGERERFICLTDTHLSPRAGSTLASEISSLLFLQEKVTAWTEEGFSQNVQWVPTPFVGDLGAMLLPIRSEMLDLPMAQSPARLLFDSQMERSVFDLAGRVAVWHNPGAGAESILVFGTSSAKLVCDFLVYRFKIVIHIWSNDVSYDVIKQIQPTAVLVAISERTLFGELLRDSAPCRPGDLRRALLAVSMVRQELNDGSGCHTQRAVDGTFKGSGESDADSLGNMVTREDGVVAYRVPQTPERIFRKRKTD